MRCEEHNYSPYLRVLQFRDLVFDSEDDFESISYSVSTKTETTDLAYQNGVYLPLQSETQLLDEGDLSVSATFDLKLYHKNDRHFIKDWVKLNCIKVGRLWAIQDKHILWAWAYITDFTETYEKYKGTFSMDLDFKLPEGVWHIANPYRTFLLPYDSCNIFDCVDMRDDETSCDKCCVSCSEGETQVCEDCICDCDIERSDSLCAMDRNKMVDELLKCGHSLKFVYDCNKAKEIFGDNSLGYKFTKTAYCKKVIAGRFYSNTILDTTNVDVILDGKFQDPTVDINGVKITLKGDYEGRIHIYSDGTATLQCNGCSTEEEIDISNFEYEDEINWTVHHGNNRVIVTGVCGCGPDVAYVFVDEVTY